MRCCHSCFRDAPLACRWLVWLAAMAVLTGCRDSREIKPVRSDAAPGPMDLLERVRAAYRQASRYTDQGVIRLRYPQQRSWAEDSAPMSVRAERPNRLHLRAYQATVVCDGQNFLARVDDVATGNMDGQILVRSAPKQMGLAELYADTLLRDSVTSGLGGQPVQLELLYAERPLETLFHEAVAKRLLSEEEFEGHPCHRIEARTGEGVFVFWIDKEEFLLRKLEYPAASMFQEFQGGGPPAQLVAEFRGASFREEIPAGSLELDVPTDAKRVHAFVLPPQPLPSQLFGKRPASFVLTDMAGNRLSQDKLAGTISLLMWFQDHPACRTSLEQLSRVRRDRFRDDRRVAFFAVCTEPSTCSNEQIGKLLSGWQVDLPLLRDLTACGRDVFHISGAPALVVLDAAGVVQVFEVGANPHLAEQLPVVLERLLAGENVAAEIVTRQRQQQEVYAKMLSAAQEPESASPANELLPPSMPRRMRMQAIGKWPELSQPGNLLVLEPAGSRLRLLVHDGPQALVELGENGEVISRHSAAPPARQWDYSRTAATSDGKRVFAATALDGPNVCLYDDRWRFIGAYPPADYRHGGVADAQLADLDDNGQLELVVAFHGTSGIHCVSLDGKLRWISHAMPDALSLAVEQGRGSQGSRVVIAGRRGDLVELDAAGQVRKSVAVEGRAVFHVFSANFDKADASRFCGLTFDDRGNSVAIGLSRDFREDWSYTLPPGAFRYPVQFITSGSWGDSAEAVWVLGAPNGTVHFIWDEGRTTDSFAVGQHLQGLALARCAGQLVLIVTAGSKLHVWQLEKLNEPKVGDKSGVRG